MNRHLFLCLFLCLNAILFGQTNTIVLQPGPDCGKNTNIWYLRSPSGRFGAVADKKTSGKGTYLCIAEWTWDFNPGRRWVLIDLMAEVSLPQDLGVRSARLSLYSPDEPTSDGFHSSYQVRRKHPIGVIQRVLEPWEANEVTWNTRPAASRVNQVVLPAPADVRQDFVDIDVTELVREMIRNPEQNHGFLIRMREEDHYRKLIFASSNYPNPALRPRLEIDYGGQRIAIDIPADCQPYVDCHPVFFPFLDLSGQMTDPSYGPELPNSCELSDYNFRIYDHTGKEVFYTNKPEEGWSGRKAMRQPDQANYQYFCSYRLPGDDQLYTMCGQFNILMPRP